MLTCEAVARDGKGARLLFAAWPLATVLLLSACTASDDPGEDGTPGVASVESVDGFIAGVASVLCRAVFECPISSDDTVLAAAVLQDQTRCEKTVLHMLNSSSMLMAIGELPSAVATGRLEYDPEAARECLKAMDESCLARNQLLELGPCGDVFKGGVSQGEACFRSMECAGDAFCDHSEQSCPGICRPRTPAGDACDDDDECSIGAADFAICDDWEGGCRQITIGARAAEGEPCQPDAHDSRPFAICERGLWCSEHTETCQRPIPTGSACRETDDVCELGSYCVLADDGPRVDADTASGTCQPVELLREEGAPCDTMDQGRPQVCDAFERYYCAPAGCARAGDGTEGSRCDTSDFGELVGCDEGFYCDLDTAICMAIKSAGEPCQSRIECESGSCDRDTDTCRDRYCDG